MGNIADKVRERVEQELAEVHKRIIAAWDNEFPNVLPQIPPLYHYTDAVGLLGILRERSLWASAIGHSNDLSEIRCAYDCARRVLNEVRKEKPFQNYNSKYFLERLDDFFEDPERPKQDGFAVSFCEKPDMLNQWRAYGEDGGFCIGFRLSMNPEHSPVRLESPVGNRIVLRKVNYDASEQREELRNRVNRVAAFLDTVTSGQKDSNVSEVAFRLFSSWLVEWIYSVKDEAFESENEWRIICLPDVKREVFGSYTYLNFPAVKARVRQGQVLPYVELQPIDSEGSLLIENVICGPNPHSELTKKAVEIALRSAGYNCPVLISVVPLRTR
jgi:hypothetical protein